MACIYKRGKTWSYSVDLGRDESGKRKKKGKGGFRTQKEAKEAAAILEAELANGIFVDEKKITFGELADQWLVAHSKEIKPTTQEIYRFALKKLNAYWGNVLISDITKITYQKMLNVMFEKKLAHNTLKTINMCANQIFKFACQFSILKENPAHYAKIPKTKTDLLDLEQNNELPKYLEKEELNKILRVIEENESYQHYVTFLTLAYTGMRRGELAALKWSDIDFRGKIISVNKTIYHPNNSILNYILQTPKTKRSKRLIPITDNVVRELSKLCVLQKENQMRHRQEWHDKNFVFTSTGHPGYPINPSLFFAVMRRNLIRAGVNTTLSPHSLRHTHTSLLAEAGVSLEAIMERLGHANDAITRTIYLHVTQETKKDAAQKFYELMSHAKNG